MYDFSQWVIIFTVYSFLGWLAETVFCMFRDKCYVNRGFLQGPLCPIYGVGAILVLLLAEPLQAYPWAVFAASVLIATALEYFAGWLLEAIFGLRWWDYSGRRLQIRGRVSLVTSLMFGGMGTALIYLLQPLFDRLLPFISSGTQRTIGAIVLFLMLRDFLNSLAAASDLSEAVKSAQQEEDGGNRLTRAFPNIQSPEFAAQLDTLKERIHRAKTQRLEKNRAAWTQWKEKSDESRAVGRAAWKELTFPKLVWVFFVGCLLGTIIEMVFCLVTSGVLMSRQGVIYGPFSQIYGFGAVLIVLLTTPIAHKSDRWLFGAGMVIGGGYETICALIQEAMLGSQSWNYAHHPFSLFGGRTSLLYMFFWGVLVVIYMRRIYPWMLGLVERISPRPQRLFAIGFSIFMVFNLTISGLAVGRWGERMAGLSADSPIEVWLDERYPDDFLREIYPHMVFAS